MMGVRAQGSQILGELWAAPTKPDGTSDISVRSQARHCTTTSRAVTWTQRFTKPITLAGLSPRPAVSQSTFYLTAGTFIVS